MTNKRKYTMDPNRINNYNKFLISLDNKTIPNKDNKNYISENKEKQDNNVIKEDDIIKAQIDKIIQTIHNNFSLNNMSSTSFTGQNNNDIMSSRVKSEDPNEYRDFLNKNLNVKIFKIFSSKPFRITEKNEDQEKMGDQGKKEEIVVEIKETINIDIEINNISDLLKLIDTYKYDPSIKYNINMKALHNIKEPLEELNNMIGMTHLKNNIVDQILYFIQDLHKNNDSTGEFLHTVIYGPPGTGKTEIAKIMGKIYSKIGILNKGTFKKVTRSDLVAGYLGQTALKTKDVIKEALGGVLFIDEAYSLGNSEKRDSFSKECIDTLCEALSNNKENLMVIIAGYESELKECFFSFNQGLDSRFTWRFKTDEYTYEDLYKIFLKKVKDIGWEIADNSNITSDWFKKNKDNFKFYGRDIETLLSKIKIAHSRRVFCREESEKKKLILQDLEKGFEIYLKNDEMKNNKQEEETKRYLYNTIYC
jgi:ATP-dependent 26S proteasome regulatory subunit